ncbi:asparagine-rich protein, putative [Pediculus humanus corporis]|uniref:Asparagine-rich protein, putative n=1 Tax=Pediculus humanus subsp. corporis TaxID=121224 RepID=E0W3D1_PEDHC|nr:asparagine-rich protein, putative [Pediculus humanus corporis]EEB20137.1 asparagine-rich protein, putative [Pediculus humanus corporis]
MSLKKFLLSSSFVFFIILNDVVECHRLITNPYPVQEYDSIVVSSDPIRITERKQENEEEGGGGGGGKNKYKKYNNEKANKRSFNDCPKNDFKCLYGSSSDDGEEEIKGQENGNYYYYNDDWKNNRDQVSYSQITESTTNLNDNNNDDKKKINSGKSYWDGHRHHHNNHGNGHNTYDDDRNRWVTLDPVPWSTSKISKWKPNVEINETPSPWLDNNHNNQQQQHPVQQFWVSGSNLKLQKPHTQWGIGSNNDIITDNRPSSFPNDNNNYSYEPHNQNEFKEPYRRRYQVSSESTNTNTHHHHHPSTYPSSGNGEWVLLSTKKGYSHPRKSNERVLWSRNIKPIDISRYHEENLTDKKYMLINKQTFGGSGKNKTVTNNGVGMIPLQIIQRNPIKKGGGEPTKTTTKKIKLEVLPSLESTTLSYGGHVEVDTKPVYDRLQDDKIKKLQNVKKNKIRKYKLVPKNMVTGKGVAQRSALTIAAVGAGMIPATMALLLPMALSRNKRSNRFQEEINRQIFTPNASPNKMKK